MSDIEPAVVPDAPAPDPVPTETFASEEAPPVVEQGEGSEAESSPAPKDEEAGEKGISKEAQSIQDRFDELTKQRRDAERREERLLELVERIGIQNEQPGQAQPEQPKTLADFNYDEAAFGAYVNEQAENRARSVARDELRSYTEEQASNRRRSDFADRETAFAKGQDDYFQVSRSQDLPITPEMASVIQGSEVGPDLAYYLGKNPSKAAEISQLQPLAAARAIGRIEGDLILAKEKASKETVGGAPPPTPRLEGREPALSVSTTSPASDKLSDAEWFKREEKRVAKQRGK